MDKSPEPSAPSAKSPTISTAPACPAILGNPLLSDPAAEARRRTPLLSPDDVELLKGIRHLLYGEGYTIRGVQRILKAKGVRFVQSVGRGEQAVAAPDPGERGEAEPTTIPMGPASDVDSNPVRLGDSGLREVDWAQGRLRRTGRMHAGPR